jgi:hypothetical protein
MECGLGIDTHHLPHKKAEARCRTCRVIPRRKPYCDVLTPTAAPSFHLVHGAHGKIIPCTVKVNSQKCGTELETIFVNRMCTVIAIMGRGEGRRFTVYNVYTKSQLTLESRLLRHITFSNNKIYLISPLC